MDFITDLLLGNIKGQAVDAILVIIDRYSKISRYIATTKRCTSVDLANILRDKVIRYYGVPDRIVTDRGLIFTS
jgi:hypothetical protein